MTARLGFASFSGLLKLYWPQQWQHREGNFNKNEARQVSASAVAAAD
jgi:hypothetical protein